MTVKQTDQQDNPPKLTVYFAGPPGGAAMAQASLQVHDELAPEAEGGEKRVVFDVKDQDYSSIWSLIKAATGAREVPPTLEQEKEMKKLEDMKVQAEKNRKRNAAIRQKQKDQELMLQKARGEVEMLRRL